MKLDLRTKTVINVDETWLGMTNFRRRSWSVPGKSNSMPAKNLQPRISMIVALDSEGGLKFSLLQANSNSSVMELFYSHLIKQLTEKKPNWRESTVILMDNAPYHTSNTMMKFYEVNKLPIMFTGPHSYSASPVELYFAAFKKDDINPN